MKQILFLLTISLLLSCGGGSDSPSVTPDIPLVVSPPPPPPPPPPPDPVEFLEVEIGEAGDRFYPVVVNITYTLDDAPQPY